MKSHRIKGIRGSLSAKINILIVIIIMAVSFLLLVISNTTYWRTVFQSRESKLNDIEIPSGDLAPYLEHFLQVFATDEYQAVREQTDREEGSESAWSPMTVWMNDTPGMDPDNPEQANMLMEWLYVSMWVDNFWEACDLESLLFEVEKDQVVYRVDARTLNREMTYLARSADFGKSGSYSPDIPAEKAGSAILVNSGDRVLFTRCLRFGLDGGGEGRVWLTDDMTDETIEHRSSLITSILIVLGLTAFIICVTVLLLRRMLIRPIRILTDAANEQVGNLESGKPFSVDIHTRDEIEQLGDAFRQMDQGIRQYIEENARITADRERANAEMAMAAKIQADMLPRVFPPFPDRKDFDIYAFMTPAKQVGGDFYDFFLIDGDHLGLVIADVSDKGVPAALFMAIAKALIKNRAQLGGTPGEILRDVNDQLCEGNNANLFVTVWFAIVEFSTGKGISVNAGHEHPVVCRAGGTFELEIYRHSVALGTLKGLRFRDRAFELHPGDCLFVYTDGVPEATAAGNIMFGTERMTEALNLDPGAAPEELIRQVKNSVDRFANGAPQFDDMTMLCFRYFGPESIQ